MNRKPDDIDPNKEELGTIIQISNDIAYVVDKNPSGKGHRLVKVATSPVVVPNNKNKGVFTKKKFTLEHLKRVYDVYHETIEKLKTIPADSPLRTKVFRRLIYNPDKIYLLGSQNELITESVDALLHILMMESKDFVSIHPTEKSTTNPTPMTTTVEKPTENVTTFQFSAVPVIHKKQEQPIIVLTQELQKQAKSTITESGQKKLAAIQEYLKKLIQARADLETEIVEPEKQVPSNSTAESQMEDVQPTSVVVDPSITNPVLTAVSNDIVPALPTEVSNEINRPITIEQPTIIQEPPVSTQIDTTNQNHSFLNEQPLNEQ